eukprot:gnl/TRDRNA2_/TRDRNA2_186228_c0_seq1.p1 gnl/TRDRNA2_/TRDRNA2_186228_c0~~gnl/TRDRNA2_/TRDRNA2_186228_c0_seq1.p1  ORF type:complete len:350 (-),score=92.79 gnl/TRDRNA2_/TRDRNA2_186228_c0_seq1:138-1187(-)
MGAASACAGGCQACSSVSLPAGRMSYPGAEAGPEGEEEKFEDGGNSRKSMAGDRVRNALNKNAKSFEAGSRIVDAAARSHKLQQRLLQAARSGDFKKTVDCVSQGADVHSKTLRGQTPLMLAAASHSKGTLDTLKFLCETMVDVESKDEAGWTPLLHACRNNQTEVVKFLLEKSASPKARATDGKTAVMLATMDGADMLVQHLASAKAQIDKKDERGWSVLFYACEDGRKDLVRWLLSKAGNPKDRAKDGTTPLMVAAESGHMKIGQMLVKKTANPNAKTEQGNTALMICLRHTKEEFAHWLLEAGVDVTIKNQENEDALDIADQQGLVALKGILEMKARVATEENDEV